MRDISKIVKPLMCLVAVLTFLSSHIAQAQPYNVEKWAPQYAARWAFEAFSPVDRVVVWRSDIKIALIGRPDILSMAAYGQDQLLDLVGALDFRHPIGVAAKAEDANFVICAAPVYRSTNNACDAAYLEHYRADWYARGLTPAVPDPVVVSANEDAPLLNRCSFFTDKSGSIGAAFISIGSLDSRDTVRNCLMQGLGLSFWKIEAFFHADYSTDENAHGIKNHELSLLKSGYLVDRVGCAGTKDKVSCFQAFIEQVEAGKK